MSVEFKSDTTAIDRLKVTIQQYQANAEDTINSYLHSEGAEIFKDSIESLLPVSGRKWRGKKAQAQGSAPFQNTTSENLAITIKNKSQWQYLYFPDDGEDTKRHQGNQQFMIRGVNQKQDIVVDNLIDRLINTFEEE